MDRRIVAHRAAFAFLAIASAVQAKGTAVVVVADDGGLDVSAVRAIRSVTAFELRRRGVEVSEDLRTEGVQPPDDHLAELVEDLDARRVFLVRIGGMLGSKVPMSLDEVTPARFSPIASASLSAATLDEADVVAQRLVSAVLDRRSADDTATMRTVTLTESRRFEKKPGERFLSFGFPVLLTHGNGSGGPLGFSLEYFYEAQSFRAGLLLETATNGGTGLGWFGIGATWLPFDSELSPYLGAGIGYMGASNEGGMGGRLEVGMELFRLHGLRLLGGIDLIVPFFGGTRSGFTTSSVQPVYPLGHVRLAF
ncbi:MAG: hypothetical protein ACJ79D_19280 [Myxococcales bacterium]